MLAENSAAAIVARAAAAAQRHDAQGGVVDAAAFAQLYPRAFLERFLKQGLRPDGRRPGICRPVTVAPGALSRAAAAGSALVRLSSPAGSAAGSAATTATATASRGSSTAVLAGVRLEVMCPSDDAPDRGGLAVAVEYAPLASAAGEASRAADAAAAGVVAERLRALLLGGNDGGTSQGLVDTRQLCIEPGRAAWAAYLDLVVLDAGGSVGDACALAAAAALGHLRLPRVRVTEEGNVEREGGGEGAMDEGEDGGEGRLTLCSGGGGGAAASALLPASATTFAAVRLSGGGGGDDGVVFLADPTAEEEALAQALVTVTVDDEAVLGVSVSPGGGGGGLGGGGDDAGQQRQHDGDAAALLTPAALLRCVALARRRLAAERVLLARPNSRA
jgi:exosome complex component RRP43